MRTGKGLKVVVALAAAGLCGAEPGAASASAEDVGLEARGIDPWAVLRNRWGLDIRDEFNRPVSARRMEADLKAASAHAAVLGAYASRLPSAAALVWAGEMPAALQDLVKTRLPAPPGSRVWALPAPGRISPRMVWLLLPGCLLCACALGSNRAALRIPASSSRLPLVLRC